MEAVGDYRAAESFRCETEEQHFFLVRPSIIERASPVRNEAIMEGNKSSDVFMNGLRGGFYTQQERVSGGESLRTADICFLHQTKDVFYDDPSEFVSQRAAATDKS